MQKNNLLAALTLSAISVLAACNSEPEVVTINKYDPQAAALANAAPVAPPPMITESHAYRCRDNSLVYIDFMNNNSAVVRNQRGEAPIATVTAPAAGQPFTSEGFSVSGSGSEISYTAPGKGSQTCTR